MMRRLSTWLAVAIPLVLGALAARSLTLPEPRAASSYSAALDALLSSAPPRWVIVGNSKAKQDVNEAQLAEELGFDGTITPVVLNGSTAPAWYAMLEQRVFGEGYRPELVIVYGQLGALLRDRVLSDTELHNIEGLAEKPSPILESRVFGLADGAVGRAHQRAFRLHDAAVTGLRERWVETLFGPPPTEARAWAAVYGADASVRSTGNTRMVPGEATTSAASMSEGAAGTTFVDAILRLCHGAGARVLFVRAPVGAQVRSRDDVPAEVEAALYAHINAAGASWIDLHAIPLPAGAFRDDFHLLPEGAAVLTAALAERMLAADVAHGGVVRATPPFRASSVVRKGTPPGITVGAISALKERACGWRAAVSGLEGLDDEALVAAGLGLTSPFIVEVDGEVLPGGAPAKDFGAACAGAAMMRPGEVRVSTASGVAPGTLTLRVTGEPSVTDAKGRTTWWVPPGTTTRWTFAGAPPGESPRVEAVVRAVTGAAATMWVNDEAVPFTPAGRVLRASAPVPAGEWRLGVQAGSDSWLVVHSLAAIGSQTSYVVGGPWAETHLLQARPKFAADPAPKQVVAVEEGEGLWRIDVPEWAPLGDDRTRAVAGKRCSPVEGSDDGSDFAKATHATLAQVRAHSGGVAHEGGALWVWRRAAQAAPAWLRLNPERSCIRGGKYFPGWLYAGDVAAMTLASKRLGAHPLGIDSLAVDAAAFGGDVSLDVVVRKRVHGGWEEEWRGAAEFVEADGRGGVTLRINPPLGVEGKREVELRVSGGYLLAFDVVLSESERGAAAGP
ncbi:hypothetical protein LBMAG42_24470 [Deltaproteobacteria bacterium]|nr:hypothetical protein LBMAG42_24470 [Deltaproteobacteria bacterium]